MASLLSTALFLLISLLICNAIGQIAPLWTATAFMEARTLLIVDNNQKLNGTYDLSVTFLSIYPSP